jgi:2-dehydropantoate 2-reductase
MRIVIFGAGGVGGVIGGRLFEHHDAHGHDVVLVARGAHAEAMRAHGLTIHDPSHSVTLPVPVVDTIDQVPLDDADVVILTMKTQDSPAALQALAAHAPAGIGVACAQNGVENERLALRCFASVYAVCVILPATFLEPGVVDANGAPHNAVLDLGCYPYGVDDRVRALAQAFEHSGLASRAEPNVMRLKYTKLLLNLVNAFDALVAPGESTSPLFAQARAEAKACFAAAGIEYASTDEDRARREGVMHVTDIDGRPRKGGSTWQSFARGSRSTEIDWLNGEIVLLGRQHGVPTPVNAMLQQLARDAAREGWPPRSLRIGDLEARL